MVSPKFSMLCCAIFRHTLEHFISVLSGFWEIHDIFWEIHKTFWEIHKIMTGNCYKS